MIALIEKAMCGAYSFASVSKLAGAALKENASSLLFCARSSTDRALVFGTRGCGFESCRAHKSKEKTHLGEFFL